MTKAVRIGCPVPAAWRDGIGLSWTGNAAMFAASHGESRPVPSALTPRSNYRQEERCGKFIAAAARTRRETAADTSAARTAYAFAPRCNARHRFEDCPPNCMRLQSFAPFSPWRFKPHRQPMDPGHHLRRHLPCPAGRCDGQEMDFCPARRCNRTAGARSASAVGFSGAPYHSCLVTATVLRSQARLPPCLARNRRPHGSRIRRCGPCHALHPAG